MNANFVLVFPFKGSSCVNHVFNKLKNYETEPFLKQHETILLAIQLQTLSTEHEHAYRSHELFIHIL
jgi:hypothetical protein